MHNTEEITTTASKMGERMIHQKFMFMFCCQHLKETNEKEEEMSLVPLPPAKNSRNLSTTSPPRLPPARKWRKSGGGQNFTLKPLRNDKHSDFRKPCPQSGPSPARTHPHSLHNKVWTLPLNIEKVAHTKAAATRFLCTQTAGKVHLETRGREKVYIVKQLCGKRTVRCSGEKLKIGSSTNFSEENAA